MLQFIHRFEKSLLVFVFLFLAGISLAGLGISSSQFSGRNVPEGVAAVNGEEISFADLSRARNNDKIPAQQAMDGLIDRSLARQFAERHGLAAGDTAVRMTLSEIAPGGMTPEGIQELLQSLHMTPVELENEIRKESISRQLYALISAAVMPSTREISQGVREFATIKTVAVASANVDGFMSLATTPSDDQIEKYYREQASDFEVPPAVAYDYVLFAPEKYQDSVVVNDDDIELYYADHQSDFAIPATVNAKHVRLLYPKDSKPEALNEVKERAQQIYSRAKAGESFDSLALEFSDDISTKFGGGNLGDIARGKMPPAFDAIVFKMQTPGLADLVEADYGFHIVMVTAVQPASVKPLSTVKEEIRAAIQKVEAPAYASARAGELGSDWKKANVPLKQFAESRGLSILTTKGQLSSDSDPAPEAKGLTASVLAQYEGGHQQQIELDNISALVDVTAKRESEVAPLASVKDQIIKILKTRDATSAMRAKTELLSKVAVADFVVEAKRLGFSVQPAIELKSADVKAPDSLNHGNLLQNLRRMAAAGIATRVFDGNEAYVAAITSIKDDSSVKPDQQKMHQQIVAQRIRYELGGLIEKSLLADEKRVAKIEIRSGAYAQE